MKPQRVHQVSTEQQIYMDESMSNRTYQDVLAEYKQICNLIQIDENDKLKSMMEHFIGYIKDQLEFKVGRPCVHCTNAKAKISELEWNKC